MKKLYLLLFIAFGFIAQAQIVNIPDANFKAKLLSASPSNNVASIETPVNDPINNSWSVSSYSTIDTNGDGEIQVSEAQAIKWMKVSVSSIFNLTGIEAFTNLHYLNCQSNQFTSLDVSGLTNLQFLSCYYNQLTNLDVSGLTNLQSLYCNNNQLTSLNVSGLTNLQLLNCYNNQLTNLDVSGLTNLQNLRCESNQLTSLDVSGLTNLRSLRCTYNQLTSLNVSGLTNLYSLGCSYNQLPSLDVSGLTNLPALDCQYNQLSSLDVSGLTYLQSLYCNNNQLTSLNIKNNISYLSLFFNNNPNLQYICADEEDVDFVQQQINNYGYSSTCHVNSYCSFTPGGTFYTIEGNNRFDYDTNGCDINDNAYPNLKINLTNGVQTGSLIANNQGNYTIPVQAGTHTMTPVLQNPSYFNISPVSIIVDFSTQASPFVQDFCVTPNGVHHDVEVSIIPIGVARPGFDASYKIMYKNVGNLIENGTILFNSYNPNVLDFVSSFPAFTSQNATTNLLTYSWDYSNLLLFESREIIINFNLNSPMEAPALNAGDILSYGAQISTTNNDENLIDNYSAIRQIVVNSFDPNDKTCLEGETINPTMIGEYVHYQIRFENTGTFPAQNIVVKDMIDVAKFDVLTLQMVHASHSCITRINGNKVEFIFENINLPFDDANNDGYVVFKIKTLPTLTVNSTISNTAEIYFDYNFPIVTNTATSTYQVLQNQDFVFENEFDLYPNPAKSVVTIKAKNQTTFHSVEVYNVVGQLVIAKPNFTETLDVSNLQSGTYFVKILTENGSATVKFVKE